jgi:DNA (cytosine-5)-methyltransferase 1
MTKYRFLEFFAGAGLARLGLEPEWECAWSNDIDETKGAAYVGNFGDDDFVLDDVANIRAADLPTGAAMAWASFPCQDLSLAGWRQGMSAGRSGTFWAFWKLMYDLFERGERPPLVVLENVTGLLSGDDFVGLAEAMAALGLQLGALVVDARHFVPQSRPRVFIIGVDERVDVEDLHAGLPGEARWFPKRLQRAHSSLPDEVVERWRWWNLPLPRTPLQPVEELIDREPEGVDWYSDEETENLIALMNEKHRDKLSELQEDSRRRVGFVYRRTRNGEQRAELRIDGLAGCLRTPSGGSSRQIVVECDGDRTRARLLSVREAARLMGVPEGYVLPRKYNDGYYAMGDAVAVPVVSWLSEHLLLPMAERAAQTLQGAETNSSDSHFRAVSQLDLSHRAIIAARLVMAPA